MEMQSSLDVEHVEKLILSLYAPNPPDVISRIQSTLSQIQSSQGAWILARELLKRADEKVQFFGALTLIVKLNTASDSLSDAEATELLKNMLGWYLESLQKVSGRLVTRKLVSAISTYFFRFYRIWPHYLAHVVVCLTAGQTRPMLDAKESINIETALASLDAQRAQAAFWVATHIVEDASRLDMNSSVNAGIYEAILQSLPDTVSLLSRCMNADAATSPVLEDSMKCLQAWVGFTQRLSSRDHLVVDSLRPLFTNVIDSLRNEASYEVAVELLIEVLSNYPALLSQEQNSMIAGLLQTPWASDLYQRLVGGDFEFDTLQFGLLYLEFAQTKVEGLIKSCNSHGKPLLYSLCGMLAADGYPIAENKIFVPAIDFWSNFAEMMPDFIPTEGEQQEEFVSPAIEFLINAVSNSWQKIIFPPGSEFSQWDSNDRAGFHDARKDVVDLLQSMYVLVGPQMVVTFVDATLSAMSEASWLRMEAAAHCLGGLADCCREDERCDEILTRLFESPLFSILQDHRDTLPPRVRQTCLSLIELYTEYFERNTKFLPPALELLFSMLADTSMASTASKSIFRLCSTCRDRLHTDIDAFLNEYQRHTTNRQLDCPSTEKILGSLACIAQAIPDQQRKYAACARILNLVEREVENSKALLAYNAEMGSSNHGIPCQDCSDDEHPALHAGLKSLRCLTSIGKGFQAPADAAIDLESSSYSEAVRDPQLAAAQKQVVNIIVTIQQTFNTSTEVTELICSVLRAGFSETEPGPFVLPPSEVAQYLASHTYATPRIGLFVSAACSFLSSMRGMPGEQDLLASILLWIISLLKQMPEVDAETELVQNGIEFTSRLLRKHPRTLLELQPSDAAEYFFLLTLQVLDGKEPLPKAAAAEFWATLVSLRPSDPEIQPLLSAAVTTLGPFLSKSLLRNIGGNASRSELDRLCEPLKKLVSRHAKSKEWLHLALNDEAFPSSKVSGDEKTVFLKKVISLRGSRATNQVVRDFWLACRGTNFAYAS